MEALSRVVMVLTLLAATACPADPVPTATVTRVAVELEDGSRIFGIPSVSSVVIRTSYAVLDIPWSRMLGGRLTDENGTAELRLRNGDRLTGKWEPSALELTAVFGKVVAGREHIRSFEVSDSGGSVPAGLREGLVLHFSFDRDEGKIVRDHSGKGNNGKVEGAKWISVGGNGVMSFDGAGDYIDIGSSSLYRSHGKLSACAWVNLRAVGGGHLLSNYQGGPATAGQLSFLYEPNRFRVVIGQRSGIAVAYESARKDLLTFGEWHHVAFSYDESRGVGKKIGIYLDGQDVGSYTVTDEGNAGEVLTSDVSLRLMACPGGGNVPGMMDEARLFSCALSSEDVRRIYQAETFRFRKGEAKSQK